jgi:putative peptidoglycan lipid II flippase
MAVGTALSRLTGLGRVAALSFALGVAESRLADSYNIANTLPNVIYELVLGGVLTSVFLPVLLQELRTRPHEQAWEAASSLVATSMAILVAVSALTVLAAPWIIRIFTLRVPGSQAVQQQELATFLLRLFAPQVALYGFAAIAAGLLNAHGRFAVPMFAPILNNLVVIASLLLFAVLVRGTPTEGSVQASLREKLLLGLGTTGGVAAMAAVFWPFLRRLPGRLRRRVDFGHPAVRKLARLSAWTLGYVAVNQIGFTVSLYLANRVQGGPTAYFTAFAFFQLPYGIAAVSIMTALAPTLASLHVDADDQGFRRRLDDGLRLSALVLVPATAAYLVLSGPLIHVLLQHGVMRGASSTLVASVLDMFAVGLLPFSAFALFMRAFYARQDARTPMLVNLVENAVTIALDLLLFPLLAVRGLALAHSLGYLAGATLAGGLLTRRVGSLASRATLAMLVKVAVAAGLAAAAMVAVLGLVGGAVSPGGEQAVAQLLAGGAVGLGVFLLAAWTLGVEELTALQRLLPGS